MGIGTIGLLIRRLVLSMSPASMLRNTSLSTTVLLACSASLITASSPYVDVVGEFLVVLLVDWHDGLVDAYIHASKYKPFHHRTFGMFGKQITAS